jgi:hypothetical protein
MIKETDIVQIAEQLLKQYRDIPSLDKSQNLLIDKYGSASFARIRKSFAELWLRKNGFEIPTLEPQVSETPKPKGKKAKKKAKGPAWKTTRVVKPETVVPISMKKAKVISRPNVPVPKIMQEVKGRTVVTTWVDPEESMPEVYVTLPVIRTETFGGKLCYVVKYGPNGVEPYEWHVEVVEPAYEGLEEIPCIYHRHTLAFNVKDRNLKKPVRAVSHFGPRPRISYAAGSSMRQTVFHHMSTIEDLLVEPVSAAPKPAPAPTPRPLCRKTPEQWYAEVGGFGKHKCGKPFVCSCCGGSFAKNQGYRIDFKEIYFCFECKKKIFRPSHRGWRGSVISIPMGNKR